MESAQEILEAYIKQHYKKSNFLSRNIIDDKRVSHRKYVHWSEKSSQKIRRLSLIITL